MGKYIVSARKYRPQTFTDVVGQETLTTTLKNAIATGKLAHAFLFCGPRGVGKTTCARIFAKTINCFQLTPEGDTCNECESCKSFDEGKSFSIHELDAASNNSVDDIRSLIEQVRIPPQVGKYKVFIVDEVHMLSPSAFNAFLKTLEEPPAHVVFILATTEKHKILATILSRCQVYDFNRMSIENIVSHLKDVAAQEQISYEEDALHVIAQKADGGMRDALSLFDQLVSFTEGKLEYKKVIENLNVLDYDYFFEITDGLLTHNVSGVLLTLDAILKKGFDGGLFIQGLTSHFRDLLVSQDAITIPLLDVSEQVGARYLEQSTRCTPEFLYRAMKGCNTCELNYKRSNNKRLLVELALIELMQAPSPQPAVAAQPAALSSSAAAPRPSSAANQTSAAASQQSGVANQTSAGSSNGSNPPASPPPSAPAAPAAPVYTPAPSKPSLGSLLRGDATEDVKAAVSPEGSSPEQPKGLGTDPFSIEQLRKQWIFYAASLPREQAAMAERMKGFIPRIAEDNTFTVEVSNEQVASDLRSIQAEILKHLRRELNNGKIEMRITITELKELPQVAFTPSEKLKQMVESYPVMQRLITSLQLEF